MAMMEAMKQSVIVIPMNISNAPVVNVRINLIVAMEVKSVDLLLIYKTQNIQKELKYKLLRLNI